MKVLAVLEQRDGALRKVSHEVLAAARGLADQSGGSVDAIQTLNDWPVVFGRYGEHFEARPLKLGRSDGKMVEVLSGLSAGEQYATGNSFVIKSELGKAGASHDH